MKSSLIALTLIIFELYSIHGHSIRVPNKNGHAKVEPYSVSDVYEIRNDGTSVTFVNPTLSDKKTREIVYYHVVEKPCSEDTAETERPFTNAHGSPFLQEFVHKDSDQGGTEAPIITTTTEFDLRNMLNDVLFPEPNDKLEITKRVVADHNLKDEIMIPEAPTVPAIRYDSFPAYMRQLLSTEPPAIPHLINKKEEKEPISETDRLRSETPESETDKHFSETPELETNVDRHVNLLRNGVNGKMIPRDEEAGIKTRTYGLSFKSGKGYVWNDLYGLDSNKDDIKTINGDKEHLLRPKIDGVPKNYIQLEKIDITTPKYRENEIKNTDEINIKMANARETITTRLKKIIKNLEQNRNINTEGERDKNSFKDETEDTAVGPNKEFVSDLQERPRTYGMQLLDGQGYVWNDIFTNPGVSYKIYNPENLFEIDMRDPISEMSNPIAQHSQNAATQSSETNTETQEDENENINTDMDDIFVHIAKFKQTTPAPDVKEDLAIKRHHKDTQKLIAELLKSDEFWALVIEWSEMYMDILTKYIKKTVKYEVEKEVEAHFSNIEIDHEKSDEANNSNSGENEEENLESTSMEPQKGTESENLTKHELIIKKDGFIIDGIELPYINYKVIKDTNKEQLLKRRKADKKKPAGNKTETANLDSNPATDKNDIVNAKNHTGLINFEHVYANNVGNEKVTNVFVFYPNEGLDKVLEELKPIAGENGILIIKPDKEEDKKKELTESETGKEELAGAEIGEVLVGKEKDGENPNKIDQKPEEKGPEKEEENGPEKEENGFEKEEIQPVTDETKYKEDSKEKTNDVELDTRRFR